MHTNVSVFCYPLLSSVLTKTRVCKAQHMAETNHELASVLFTKKDATGKADVPELNQDTQRKLSRIQTIRKMENTEANVIGVSSCSKQPLTYMYTCH